MAEAIATREKLKREIEQPNRATVPSRSLTRFATRWWSETEASGRWAENTAHSYRKVLEHHVLPYLGHIHVDELERDDIRRWIARMESMRIDGEPYANSSLRRYWRVMLLLIKALYLEGHIDRRFSDWTREIEGPTSTVKDPRREDGTLSADELLAYLEAARERRETRYAEIVTLAFTGMRAGELYGLDMEHVDFDARCIRVEQSYSMGTLGPTKTGRTREVPMVPLVAEAIREHREWLFRQQNVGAIRDGIVFPGDTGKRRFASINKPMAQLAEHLGLEVKVGPQVLRSTLITLLGNAGVPVDLIRSISGHRTLDMHAHYSRPRHEDQRKVIELAMAGAEVEEDEQVEMIGGLVEELAG
jgi:integrase